MKNFRVGLEVFKKILLLVLVVSFVFYLLVYSHHLSMYEIINKMALVEAIKSSNFSRTYNHTDGAGTSQSGQLVPRPNRHLVYYCDGWCGGWGDRLKGIMSSYAWALLTKRSFVIRITQPCQFDQLFVP